MTEKNQNIGIAGMENQLAKALRKETNIAAQVKAIQEKHAMERDHMLNREEKIIHERVNGTIEHSYNNRREISHLERLFQDRVKDIIGQVASHALLEQ